VLRARKVVFRSWRKSSTSRGGRDADTLLASYLPQTSGEICLSSRIQRKQGDIGDLGACCAAALIVGETGLLAGAAKGALLQRKKEKRFGSTLGEGLGVGTYSTGEKKTILNKGGRKSCKDNLKLGWHVEEGKTHSSPCRWGGKREAASGG